MFIKKLPWSCWRGFGSGACKTIPHQNKNHFACFLIMMLFTMSVVTKCGWSSSSIGRWQNSNRFVIGKGSLQFNSYSLILPTDYHSSIVYWKKLLTAQWRLDRPRKLVTLFGMMQWEWSRFDFEFFSWPNCNRYFQATLARREQTDHCVLQDKVSSPIC